MKRSSWIAVGIFGVLLAVWLAKGVKGPPTAPAPLSIDGYVGAVSENELRAQTKDKLPPVTTLVVKTQEGELTLAQLPQDPPGTATPSAAEPPKSQEAKWKAKYVRKGRTSEAGATPYRASAMAEVFGRSIRSTFAKEIKESDKAEFGLDSAQAIDVQVQWAGRSVQLRIGKLDKGSDGAEPTTWVQDPARPAVAYQVAGRDLRTPFETRWSDLRDRNLLSLDLSAVDGIEVHNPGDPRASEFALRRATNPPGTKREPGEGWSISSPAGYVAGDVAEWLRSLERLSAADFVDPADVDAAKTPTGLDDPKSAAKLTLSAGSAKTVLVFGAVDAASESKDVWLRIEGRDELYKIAGYSRDQVLLRFDQVRQRALLGQVKAKEIQEFSLRGPSGDVSVRRVDGHWRLASGEAAADSAAVSFLSDLESIQVDFAADVTLGSAGLAAPEWTLTLTTAGGDKITGEFSKESDGHVFGSVRGATGSIDIFKLQTWNAAKIRKKAEDFADKRLFPVTKDAVNAIEVRPAQGETFGATQAAAGWDLSRGGKVQNVKADTLTKWLNDLIAVERGSSSAKSPAEVGLDKGYDLIQITTTGGAVLQVAVSKKDSGEEVWVSPLKGGKATQVGSIPLTSAAPLRMTADALLQSAGSDPAPASSAGHP